MKKYKFIIIAVAIFFVLSFILNFKKDREVVGDNLNNQLENSEVSKISESLEAKDGEVKDLSGAEKFEVIKVVDGDTLDVKIAGKIERLRLIGINTPETVDPRKPVQCFGLEASKKAKETLSGKKVILEIDPTQGDRDKYGRLLRYVFLEDGTNFNLMMINDGYAYEYTYNIPYKYQTEFKQAQKIAEENKRGLWGDICNGETLLPHTPILSGTNGDNSCNIKGNISSTGEKIYHLPTCAYYKQTVINESQGEKYFCSEKEAVDAGWRKALNCN